MGANLQDAKEAGGAGGHNGLLCARRQKRWKKRVRVPNVDQPNAELSNEG